MSRHHNLLIRARHGAVLAGCGLLVLVSACSRSSRDVEIVLPETRFEITADKPALLEQELAAGAYSLTVTEDSIDVRTQISGIGNAFEISEPVRRHGLQLAYVRLDEPGVVRLNISSDDYPTKTGSVLLSIVRWKRAANAPAGDSERADQLFAEALASRQNDKSQTPRTTQLLTDAARLYDRANERRWSAIAHYTLGRMLYIRGKNWLAAEQAAETAANAFHKLGDFVNAARAQVLAASTLIERAGELSGVENRVERLAILKGADDRLQRSAAQFRKDKKLVDLADALTFAGVGRWSARNVVGAREAFSEAADLSRASNDSFFESRARGNLAWLEYENSNVQSAATEYRRLLDITDENREPDFYASVVSNLALCLTSLGKYEQALQLHTEALDLLAKRNNDAGRARQLLAIGSLYLRTGAQERALETLKTSLALLTEARDQTGVDTALEQAGIAAGALGLNELRANYHRRLFADTLNPRTKSRSRVRLAGALTALQDYSEAEQLIAEAMKTADDSLMADALVERAALRKAQSRYAEAVDDFSKANELYTRIALDYKRIAALTGLSNVRLANGQVAKALVAADEAISLVSALQLNASSPELQARIVAGQYSPYEARIAALLTASSSPNSANKWEALATAETVRARLLDDLQRSDIGSDVTRTTGEDVLRDRLTAQQLRLEARLQRFDSSDPQALQLKREIEETRAQFDAIPLEKLTWTPRRNRVRSTIFELETAQSPVPVDTAILYFFVGDQTTFAWLLTRDSLRVSELPGRVALEHFVADFVNSLRSTTDLTASTDRKILSSFSSLVDHVEQKRLIVVPDGPLHAMPFAAIGHSSRASDSRIWLDQFSIVYSPSLAYAIASKDLNATAPRNLVAVVADPVYAIDDSRLGRQVSASKRSLLTLRSADSTPFVRLPSSAVEAAQVARYFNPERVVGLSGFDASAARVAKLPFERLAVLHFATHAVARSDSPSLSALFLSEFALNGDALPKGSLTSLDVRRMGMRADLVVLSACSSGNGERVRGEGVLGLTHSFLANGSGAVIAALWPVEDASTAQFMAEFYRSYSELHSPADALRQAQLTFRSLASAQSKDVWASFFIRGRGQVPDASNVLTGGTT